MSAPPPRHWLGVVSRDHVMRGVGLGICQIGHGKRAPLERMAPGDGLVYYSPRESPGAGATLRAFTAIGRIAEGEVWQADEDGWRPWRRRVDYAGGTTDVPVASLAGRLDLTAAPGWGRALRRGLVPLSDGDFVVIAAAMGAPRT